MSTPEERPAADLVRLLEALLDDGDQVLDTPEHPNVAFVWAVRHVLEDFGGRPHRWSHPRCETCAHMVGFHEHGACQLCRCTLPAVTRTPPPAVRWP